MKEMVLLEDIEVKETRKTKETTEITEAQATGITDTTEIEVINLKQTTETTDVTEVRKTVEVIETEVPATIVISAEAVRKAQWKVAVYAGLGAVFGFLAAKGLSKEINHGWLSWWAQSAFLLGITILAWLDKITNWIILHVGELSKPVVEKGKDVVESAIATPILIAAMAFAAFDREHLPEQMLLLGAISLTGWLAVCWIRAAQQQRQRREWQTSILVARARRPKPIQKSTLAVAGAGAFGGLVPALGSMLVLALMLYMKMPANGLGIFSPSSHVSSWSQAGLLVAASVAFFSGIGFLGGLAVDQRWGRCPARGVLAALAAFSIVLTMLYLIPYWIHGMWKPQFLPLAAVSLGCGLALLHCEEDLDLVLEVGDSRQHEITKPAIEWSLTVRALATSVAMKVFFILIYAFIFIRIIVIYIPPPPPTPRTCHQIKPDVEERLKEDSGMHGNPPRVDCDDSKRVVTLSGAVEKEEQKTAAYEEAKSVKGVRDVDNRLEVRPPDIDPTTTKTLPAGTPIRVYLLETIATDKNISGQTFAATLAYPLAVDGEVVIPAGYGLDGHIVSLKSAGKFVGQSELILQLDHLVVQDKIYNLQTDQFQREGKSRSQDTVAKVGTGGAVGGFLGGLLHGGKGTLAGGAAGAGAGAGVQAATKGEQIRLPAESPLTFRLLAPLSVTVTSQGPDSGRRTLKKP